MNLRSKSKNSDFTDIEIFCRSIVAGWFSLKQHQGGQLYLDASSLLAPIRTETAIRKPD